MKQVVLARRDNCHSLQVWLHKISEKSNEKLLEQKRIQQNNQIQDIPKSMASLHTNNEQLEV